MSCILRKIACKLLFSFVCIITVHVLQSGPLISVGRNISALVGCFKKLRALYEVQFLETFQIQQLDLH